MAIKIIDKKKAQEDPYVAKNFKREAKLLQKLSHPNIVRLYEVVETEHNYYLVTELCTGLIIKGWSQLLFSTIIRWGPDEVYIQVWPT